MLKEMLEALYALRQQELALSHATAKVCML